MKSYIALAFTLTAALAFTSACARHDETVAHDTAGTATSTTSATSTQVTTETSLTSSTTTATETLAAAPPPTGVEPVAGPKLTPIDQGPSDASFVAYRDKLRDAVRRRDVKGVVALADPKIRTSFGGGGGHADLEKMLAKPGMWEDLEAAITHGGTFVGEGAPRSFWAPYVYSVWPEQSDPFSHFAVIGENVPLRKSTGDDAEVVAMLSYDIVERVPRADEGGWRQVKTADGRSGFVEAKQLLSPVGYRAGFNKTNGTWKMDALVIGD